MLRRSFLLGTLATVLAPGCTFAGASKRLSFTGSLKQGSLVIGTTEPGATVSVNAAPVLVSGNGTFAFGFEYDQKKPSSVVARFSDGTSQSRDVAPVVRDYEVQRINGLR